MANWRPFSHEKTDWFDPEWMFGIKGFDIVIGNPPYVDVKNLPKDRVKFYFNNYQTTENRINLYSIFIEKGLSLLDHNGILAFINPNSILVNESYKKIRNLIIDHVKKLIKLPDSIFKEAIVETILLFVSSKADDSEVLGKTFKRIDKLNFETIEFDRFAKNRWKEDSEVRFNIFSDSVTNNLISKIEANATPLSTLVDFSLGITPYDSYKGHNKELIEGRSFHSKTKDTLEHVPLISGKNIHHYYITDDVNEYLKYGSWLGAPRERKFFEEPKIIIRQILAGQDLRIVAGYSEGPHYFTQIGFSMISKASNVSLLKYLTAILNSKLMSYYHKEKYLDKEKKVFQKILIANSKTLPIKIEFKAELVSLVDKILDCVTNLDFEPIEPIMRKIDLLVYKIYKLTVEEVLLIDNMSSETILLQ
ncbi:MAG: Eco57I restriction-modification methylase domain-containing protein [Mucilaginibacter sp.]